MAIYGFGHDNASQLLKVARREGQRSRGKTSVVYPEFLDTSQGEILVKNATGSDIAINSSGTFQVWSGTPGSESDTGLTITAYNKTSLAFKNGKFGSVGWLMGQAYAVPWQT